MTLFPLLGVKRLVNYLDKLPTFALINEKIAHSRLKDQNPNKLLVFPFLSKTHYLSIRLVFLSTYHLAKANLAITG